MSFWRKEKTKVVKMPIWINPKLHKKLKRFCTNQDVSIKDFVEAVISEQLDKERLLNNPIKSKGKP